MNLFSIRWSDYELVGIFASIKAQANILESKQITFKVSACGSGSMGQENFGLCSFKYWMRPEDILE